MKHITLKAVLPYAVICMFVFFASGVLGYATAVSNPKDAVNLFKNFKTHQADPIALNPPFTQMVIVIISNSMIGLMMLLSGILFLFWFRLWFGSFFLLIYNGYMLGNLGFIIVKALGIYNTFISLFTHGVFEFSAIFLSAGVGLFMGYNITLERCNGAVPIREALKESFNFYVTVIFPIFIIAGFLEVYVSTLVIKWIIANNLIG